MLFKTAILGFAFWQKSWGQSRPPKSDAMNLTSTNMTRSENVTTTTTSTPSVATKKNDDKDRNEEKAADKKREEKKVKDEKEEDGKGEKKHEEKKDEKKVNEKDDEDYIGDFQKVQSLGSGVSGVVYEVERGGKRYALKKTKDRYDESLREEFAVLNEMKTEDGFPRAHAFFKCGGKDCLVMDLVGPVVSSLQRHMNRFPPETVGSIAIQLIDRIEALHKHGIVHGDLYRNNMSPGRGSNKTKMYAIDFGQVKTKRPKKFDVKSILCTIIGLLRIQENCSHDDDYSRDHRIVRGVPEPVAELIRYVESLSSDSRIDYDRMRKYMLRLIKDAGFEYKAEVIWPKEIVNLLD